MKDYMNYVITSYIINDIVMSGFALYVAYSYFKTKKKLNEKAK